MREAGILPNFAIHRNYRARHAENQQSVLKKLLKYKRCERMIAAALASENRRKRSLQSHNSIKAERQRIFVSISTPISLVVFIRIGKTVRGI